MRVFVYGTLCDRDTASDVLDQFEYAGPATLVGLHRVEGAYPTLTPGGQTEGRILVTDDVAALDRYEGVDRGLYVRVSVPHVDGGTIETYVGDPDPLDAPATWPGDGSFSDRVRAYVVDTGVEVRPSAHAQS